MSIVTVEVMGAIHSTKIPTGPTGKSGPPQKVDPLFRNFSGRTEPIHWVLDRIFRKFWLNGSRPWCIYPGLYQSSSKVNSQGQASGRSLNWGTLIMVPASTQLTLTPGQEKEDTKSQEKAAKAEIDDTGKKIY